MKTNIQVPSCIKIGAGALQELPDLLSQMQLLSPLCVVDPNLIRLGVTKPIFASLAGAGVSLAVFDKIVEDPTDISVNAAVEKIAQGGHDGLIAIGGGSSIDTAKAAALTARLCKPISNLKVPKVNNEPGLPVIAIPTTAGSGSEVSQACVITDSVTNEKMLILGRACLPSASIIDFELSMTCPLSVTAYTGLDAFCHALEAAVNRNRNSYSDALAFSALSLIGHNLEIVCGDLGNRKAREAMAMGAMQAGLAVSNTNTALIHGMSRPLGALFHVPHGLSIAMLMPTVTRYSLSSASTSYANCARAAGWSQVDDTDEVAAAALVSRLTKLNQSLNVPSPAEFGIDRSSYFDNLEKMVEQAIESQTPLNNPLIPTRAEMKEIYCEIWEG